jgi:DNA-binding PadR family transcriptional regulator
MPVAFGAIIGNMAKGAVKSVIRKKGLNVLDTALKYYTKSNNVMKIGDYYTHKAFNSNVGIKDIYKGYKAVNQALHIGNVSNAKQLYDTGKSIYNKVSSLSGKDKRILEKIGKQLDFELNEFDTAIFKFSQLEGKQGSFSFEELVKADNGRFLSSITKNLPSMEAKEFKFSRYDANVIFKYFEKDEKLSLDELKEKLHEKYKKGNEADREYIILTKRLDKLKDNGYVDYDDDSRTYSITGKGKEDARNIVKKFEFTSYDSNVIFAYIEKAGGRLSLSDLKKQLDTQYSLEEKFKQLEYIEGRCEKNVKSGYLEKNSFGEYMVTEKGFQKAEEYLVENIEKAKERLEWLGRMNFVNIHMDGIIEVTDMFYYNLEIRDLLNPTDMIAIQEKEDARESEQRRKDNEAELKINNYHKYVVKELENFPNGVSIEEIYDKYKNELSIEGAARKANSFVRACENLTKNEYLIKVEDKFYMHSNTRKMIYGELKFSYADERIFRDLKKDPLALKEENLKTKYADNQDKLKLVQGRAKRLEQEGFIKKSGEGYEITELGIEKQKEFKANISYLLNGFKAGRYDTEAILKLFGQQNKLSLDELKENLVKKFGESEGNKHFEAINLRLEKLIEKECVRFDKITNTYSITEKGFEELRFKLKPFDKRNIFSLFDENNKLSLEQLQDTMKSKFSDESEYAKSFNMINGRINKLYENNLLEYENGIYSITEKGFEESKKLTQDIRFGKYDYDVIFKYFDESNTLSTDKLREVLSKKFENIDELNKNFNITMSRINKLVDNNYINYNPIDKIYSISQKGFEEAKRLQEVKVSKYDANILFKNFGDTNSLTLDKLKSNLEEKFSNPKEAEKQYNIMSKRIDKLYSHGFIEFNEKENSYSITSMGFDAAKEARQKFEFTGYDVNVLFNYIEKADDRLSLAKLDDFLQEEYKSQSDRLDQYEYLKARLENNFKEGYLGKIDDEYFITEKGLDAADEIIKKQEEKEKYYESKKHTDRSELTNESTIKENLNKAKSKEIDTSNFKLTAYDTEIFNKAKNGINLDDKLNEFRERYKDNTKELKRQMRMLESRCLKLEATGYLELGPNNTYRLTDKAIEHMEGRNKKRVQNENRDLELTKYDVNYIFKNFHEGKLDVVILDSKFKAQYLDTAEYSRQMKMFNGRLKKLEDSGYISFDKNLQTYNITEIGFKEIERFKMDSIKPISEVRELAKNYKLNETAINHITTLHTERKFPDKSYFINNFDFKEEIRNTLIDTESRIEKTLDNKTPGFCFYKTYPNAIGRDFNGQELFTMRVVLREDGNVVTAYPIHLNNIVNDKFSITKFDYTNIFEVSKDKKWSKELLRTKFEDLSDNMFYNKVLSVEKRLKNLEDINAVNYIGDGVYELSDFYIERARLSKEKGLSKLTTEQKKIMMDLKNFYNLTSSQIEDFIYKDFVHYAKDEANKLVHNGYINVTSRDLYGDSNFTDIYYLTTKGKKAISHISGEEIDKIFDSKLHNRPEELKHDLYVYSAYKDVEKHLIKNDIVIDKHYTDKDLRSLDMKTSGKQRIEYPDLRIEFTDKKTGEKGFINVEVDCGYKPNIIKSKSENIENLVWYTDSSKQADKIINVTKSNKVVVISL